MTVAWCVHCRRFVSSTFVAEVEAPDGQPLNQYRCAPRGHLFAEPATYPGVNRKLDL